MLRGAAGGGDTSPMCGTVLNARKHCNTPLVKPRASLRASHLSSHHHSPPSRSRVAPRPSPIASRPSCARLHRLPAHPHRAPSPAGVGRRPRQRPLVVTPRTLTAARWSPYSARRRRAAPSPRPEASPGTAAPPSARGEGDVRRTPPRPPRGHSNGRLREAGRRRRERPSRARARGSPPRCPSTARRSLLAASVVNDCGRRGESRWSVGLRRRPEPLVGVMRGGAPGGPRPMSYVAT